MRVRARARAYHCACVCALCRSTRRLVPRALRGERSASPPRQFSPSVARLSFALLFAPPLSRSLPLFSPLARASCSPANPLRHALACVNHAYRFSFVRASEGRCFGSRSRMVAAPPLSPSPIPLLLTEDPGAVPCCRRSSLLETHTRTWYPDSFRTMALVLTLFFCPSPPPPLALSLSLFLLPPSSSSPRTFQHSCRAKPSTLSPLTIFAPPLPPLCPAITGLHPERNVREARRNVETKNTLDPSNTLSFTDVTLLVI